MKIIGKIKPFEGLALVLLFMASPMNAEEPRSLESYPEATRLWMGLEEGVIRPAAYEQVRSTSSGYYMIHVADGEFLEKGRHWATRDPEQLSLDTEELQLSELRLGQKIQETKRSKQEANVRLRLQLHEAQSRREDLLEASRSDELATALRRRAKEAVAQIDAEILDYKKMLDPKELEKELKLTNDEGELQLKFKRKQLDAIKKISEFTANFSGELRLSDQVIEKLKARSDPSKPIWLEASELIATIINDERYEITVIATSPLLSQIPRENLLVFLQEGRTGRLIGGEYERTIEMDSGSEIVRHYIFSIRDKSVNDARHSMGQKSLVHIYRKFDEKFRLVHKRDIAFLAPQILESSGWGGVVNHLWPGSTTIQVGPQTIAVKPKNEN